MWLSRTCLFTQHLFCALVSMDKHCQVLVAPTASYNLRVSTSLPSMGVLDPTSSTVCQICGIPGHNALQCNNHFNHGFIANDLPKSFVAMSVGESKMLPGTLIPLRQLI